MTAAPPTVPRGLINVSGSITAGPGGAGFCAFNPDTACTADATRSALHGGDTCLPGGCHRRNLSLSRHAGTRAQSSAFPKL